VDKLEPLTQCFKHGRIEAVEARPLATNGRSPGLRGHIANNNVLLKTQSRLPWQALFLELFLSCVIFLTGCVNLDDVAQLTKLADSAQQTLPEVIADLPKSCQRQNALLNDIPTAERPSSFQPQECKPYQDVADHLTKDQHVLIAYFDALGKLASNAPLSYDQHIDANVATIEKLPNLSKNTIAASSAAQKIAKVLTDGVTQSYRQHKVNSLIETTDDAVQELTSDLKKAILLDYAAGILSNENAVLDIYYKSPIAAAGRSDRLTLILVQRQYNNDTMALQLKESASVSYGTVMDNLASIHAKLKTAAIKKASMREIAQQIGPYIANLKEAISQLQTEQK